jgi:5-deoxy-glucuronate isomerase
MARLISPPSENDALIIPAGSADVPKTYFRLAQLEPGETLRAAQPDFELLVVVLSGRARIQVNETVFDEVGLRSSVWSGNADSVYAGTQAQITVQGIAERTEIAIAGGFCKEKFAPFRILPGDVETVAVGSVDTHTQRSIHHILGPNGNGRAGNLLVSELYAAPGCWSGYPPHKHDTDNLPQESAFEEVYHYRFDPETGFGGQYHYRAGETPSAAMTTHRSTFVVDDGYHPTSTSPGHRGYIFTILVGKTQRSLVQWFEEKHHHLFAGIPGLQAMRDKFK